MSVEWKDVCGKCEQVLVMPDDPTQKPVHGCWMESYDWEEVFKYADGHWAIAPGEEVPKDQPFTREDVAEILGSDEGENDGPSWIMLGRLKNGLFFFIEAGCDYTGWDCQAGGTACVHSDLNALITMGMTNDFRDRLKQDLVRVGYAAPESNSVAQKEDT